MDGDEDCLFLNVYTPDIKSKGKYPVMVYVGSGGFFIDYGEKLRVGPDYLIKKEIVLVTLNYRLGVLGTLSVDSIHNRVCIPVSCLIFSKVNV